MANILTVTGSFPSVLGPGVELARRLAASGYRLTVAAEPEARALVEGQGLDFRPLEASRYRSFLETDAERCTVDRLRHLRRRRAEAAASMAVAGFARTLRELRPDLVLIDGEMHEHVIAALPTGIPLALLNSFVSIWRRPGLPPPHTAVRPGAGFLGSELGIRLLWLALRLRKARRAASQRLRRVGCDRLSVLTRLARDGGLDLRRETDRSQWLIPFTWRHLPVLSLHALEFEFPHRPAPGVHYVGPMVLRTRGDAAGDPADRARLEAIFARRRAQPGCRLIYAGFGSVFSTDLALVERLCGIVGQRPDWELVLSLGGRPAPAVLGSLPTRVHAFSWLPQLEVLEQADAAVTHGGINTLDECVLSGVPVLVYCGGETDMAGNTARVVYHGIGIAGDRRRDDTARICEHLERLWNEPGFADNLQRLRRSYQAYAEERVAERTVAALLRAEIPSGAPPRRPRLGARDASP